MKLMTAAMRIGGSIHTIDENEYHFKPEAGGTTHVCHVDDANHIKRFLSIDGFEIAGSPAAKAALKPEPPIKEDPPVITPEPATLAAGSIPADAITANVVTPAPDGDEAPTPLETMTRDELADIHKEVTGKKPHYKWEHAKIITEIRAHAGN